MPGISTFSQSELAERWANMARADAARIKSLEDTLARLRLAWDAICDERGLTCDCEACSFCEIANLLDEED